MIKGNTRTFAMMGVPGSGKGTQARMLSEKTGYKVFSSGDRYREIAKENTFVGKKIKNIIDNGYLTPHWFASFLFEEVILHLPHEEGIIFEGVGRREDEAKLFHGVAEWLERPYKVFYLVVDEDEIFKRLKIRAQEEGREDDSNARIETRISEYKKHTFPAVEHFRSQGNVIDINGEQSRADVHRDVMKAFEELP
jgi:adenylate kinase